MIFLGESHGIATNDDVNFALLTHLHETAGVRTYIAEMGYSTGHFLNEYVQTGDENLLDNVYSALEGTTAWNRSQVAFWQQVYAWNQTLPAAERIRVIGLDVQHQYPVGVWHLTTLLSEAPPAAFVEPVTALHTMVADNDWRASVCMTAVEALSAAIIAQPDDARAYFGDTLDEARFVLHSLQAGFAYYTTDDYHAANVARDRYMAET